MRHIKREPEICVHQELMDRLNHLMIAIKVHHHVTTRDAEKVKEHYAIPSAAQLDELLFKINAVLSKDVIKPKY